MRAGNLDRRITIQRAATSTDAFGSKVETWFDLATVWASKEDIRDGERLQAQEVAAHITTRFQIRYSVTVADVNPKDRIIYNGKTFDIFGVKEISRREGLEITATARADG